MSEFRRVIKGLQKGYELRIWQGVYFIDCQHHRHVRGDLGDDSLILDIVSPRLDYHQHHINISQGTFDAAIHCSI